MESTTQRTLLAGKIHRATVAQCELHCKRSCAVDDDLLEASGIAEFEQIHIWNTDNSARFQIDTIRAQRGGGTISVNGSVARQAAVGDRVIIAAFGQLLADQVAGFQPKLVFFDEANRIGGERPTIAVQGL